MSLLIPSLGIGPLRYDKAHLVSITFIPSSLTLFKIKFLFSKFDNKDAI